MLGEYHLSPWMRNPSINPGKTIEIEIYITGVGNIPTDIKLNISNPASILKADKEGHVGYAQTCIIIGKDRNNNIVSIATGNNKLKDSSTGEIMPAIQKFPQTKTGSTLSLNEGFFLSSQFISKLQKKKIDIGDKRISGESSWDGHPPIFLKLNTSTDAPPGDHKFGLTLSYEDGENIRVDQNEVYIHIKNWIEQYETYLKWFALIAGISGIIQTIFTVLQYYKPL